MAEFPALPFWTDSYLADTRDLTAAQHGAYLLLLMTAWRTKDNGLPDDDARLARWACMDRRTWLKNKTIIMSFWCKIDGMWHQKRLDDERKRAEYVRDCQVQAGRASALKRKKARSTRDTTEQPTPLQPPSTSPSTISSSNEEDNTPLPPKTKVEESIDVYLITEAVNLYNDLAEKIKIPKVQKLSSARRTRLKKRLEDSGGLEGWKEALKKLESIPAMRGENDRGWKADFDFLTNESSFIKLMEGKYDGWSRKQTQTERTKQQLQDWVDGR